MIAILSDIHGNYPALRAVLEDVDKVGCKRIISLGDVAGYYCMVNECIGALRARDVVNLMGNHDDYLVSQTSCARSKAAMRCIEFQQRIISPGNRQWLAASISTLDFEDVSMVHGGWKDPLDEYLHAISESYFEGRAARNYFSGHTHVQVHATFGNKVYCNPGSVGQPRDGDPRAAYAILDRGELALRRVAYDIDAIGEAMKAAGFEAYFYENLYSGTRIGGGITSITIS
jgi:predicted phosphodiesterase